MFFRHLSFRLASRLSRAPLRPSFRRLSSSTEKRAPIGELPKCITRTANHQQLTCSTEFATVFSGASVVVSLTGLYFAHSTLKQNERVASDHRTAETATLIERLLTEVQTPAFHAAVSLIEEFQKKNGTDMVAAFKAEREAMGGAWDVNMARRLVFHFYWKIYSLVKCGALGEEQLEFILEKGSVERFITVHCKLDEAIDDRSGVRDSKPVFEFFTRVHKNLPGKK
jgi:hypothetical protein